MTDVNSVARAELRSFIERIERLEEEKAAISGDIKDVKGEAKGRGYDVGAINTIIKLRKKDANERAEEEAILDTYMAALGMIPQSDLFEEPHDRETGELSPRLAKQVVDGMQTEAGRAVLVAAVDIMIDREEAEEKNSPETATTQRVNGHSQHEGANAQATVRNEVVTVGGDESGTVSNSPSDDDAISEVNGNAGLENAAGVEPSSSDQIDPNEDREEGQSLDGETVDANTGGDHVTAHQSFAVQAGASVQVAPAIILRPNCRNPENCGGYGSKHCGSCLKAITPELEAAE